MYQDFNTKNMQSEISLREFENNLNLLNISTSLLIITQHCELIAKELELLAFRE